MRMRGAARRAVWLAGAAAIMPVGAAGAAEPPAQAEQPAAFVPPDAPMVLTRSLRRSLPGGAEIRTSRSYSIRFVREADGYRVEGALIDVAVDAPPALAALATLERARGDGH